LHPCLTLLLQLLLWLLDRSPWLLALWSVPTCCLTSFALQRWLGLLLDIL
jgi:hypothetical protein